MLTRLQITNFKNIGDPGLDLEIRPLTILVGPNGGGKSSVLDAVALMAQRGGQRGPLWNAPRSWPDLVHKHGGAGRAELDAMFTSERWACHIDAGLGWKSAPSNGGMADRTWLIRATRGQVPYGSGAETNPTWIGANGDSLIALLAKIFGSREYRPIAD